MTSELFDLLDESTAGDLYVQSSYFAVDPGYVHLEDY